MKEIKEIIEMKEYDGKIDTDRIIEHPAKKITQKRLVIMDD